MFFRKKKNVPEVGDDAHAVQIVAANNQRTFVLDEQKLNSVLLQDDIKDRNVVVVSVAGAFRKGKSLLLCFFLRYLYAEYIYHDANDWLGDEDQPLLGFSWRGGSERDTTGILMWSEVFVHDYPNGEKVAIILLDTQGAFDTQSTVQECATVFALSTMLSSVQIFNLSGNIRENDLQNLQFFSEYGRLALADSDKKPFQRLQFLVRDWSYPYEAEYGAVGGKLILDRRLAITDEQHPDLQSVRRHIKSCFTEITCFLMPHPGMVVMTDPNFDGRLAVIEQEFKNSLNEFVPMLLAPENLIKKEINGEKVKVRDLAYYLKSYLAIYKRNELSQPLSVLHATAVANNLAAVAAATDLYVQLMEGACGGHKPYISPPFLQELHKRFKKRAMDNFSEKRKMGGEEYAAWYRQKLSIDLDALCNNFAAYNHNKHFFRALRTPAIYLVITIVMFLLSVLFATIRFYTLAQFCFIIMLSTLLLFTTWVYIQYSGEMRFIGQFLEHFANFIWKHRYLLAKLAVFVMFLFVGLTYTLLH